MTHTFDFEVSLHWLLWPTVVRFISSTGVYWMFSFHSLFEKIRRLWDIFTFQIKTQNIQSTPVLLTWSLGFWSLLIKWSGHQLVMLWKWNSLRKNLKTFALGLNREQKVFSYFELGNFLTCVLGMPFINLFMIKFEWWILNIWFGYKKISTEKNLISFSNFQTEKNSLKKNCEKNLAHVIEQQNFGIPNPQYLQRNFRFDFFNDSENTFWGFFEI